MGVRITEPENVVAMFDSVTGFAFGPVFDTADDCQAFLNWLPNDPRNMSDGDLESAHNAWRKTQECGECGAPIGQAHDPTCTVVTP